MGTFYALYEDYKGADGPQELMEHETHKQHKETDRTDLQTASLFFILALLTGLFVLAFKWAVLTPNTAVSSPHQVESASK